MESAPTPSTFKTPNKPDASYFVEKTMQNTWISNKYVSNWGIHESIREIIQNQVDGITEKYLNNYKVFPLKNGYEFDFKVDDESLKIIGGIRYDIDQEKLTVWNEGELQTGDLLLGGTKNLSNNKLLKGRFGEGMKLAALALTRNSKIFKIITRGEEWRFELKEDQRFIKDGESQTCLFWSNEKCNSETYNGKVTVIIRNLTLDEWKQEIDNYLWLTQKNTITIQAKDDKNNIIGEILFGDDFANKIYVKDIFVMNTEKPFKTYFGFNTDLDLDRDRNCTPNQAQRNHKTSQIIAYLLNNRKILYGKLNEEFSEKLQKLPERVLDMLSRNEQVVYYLHNYIKREGADLLWYEWQKNTNFVNKQPATADMAIIIKNFILDKKLPEEFYPYTNQVSWLQFENLKMAGNYETIQARFDNVKNGSKVIINSEDENKIIENIVKQMEKFVPGFKKEFIQFKDYTVKIDKKFCYAENNIIYFSNKILSDTDWKNFVLAKCLEIKRVSYQKMVELLKLMD